MIGIRLKIGARALAQSQAKDYFIIFRIIHRLFHDRATQKYRASLHYCNNTSLHHTTCFKNFNSQLDLKFVCFGLFFCIQLKIGAHTHTHAHPPRHRHFQSPRKKCCTTQCHCFHSRILASKGNISRSLSLASGFVSQDHSILNHSTLGKVQ